MRSIDPEEGYLRDPESVAPDPLQLVPPTLAEPRHLEEVVDLVDQWQQRSKIDIDAALREVNESNVRLTPGAQYAGITLVESHGITSLGTTHAYMDRLDDAQRHTRQGPCLSAPWEQHTLHIVDLSVEQRWPEFRDAAMQQMPVRSVLSFRLSKHENNIADMNFAAHTPGVFDDDSVEAGLVVAAHTAVAWNLMRRDTQFRSALASRDLIGQAKGILMERFSIDAAAAFELLKRISQENNTKLANIARKVVDTAQRTT